MTAEESTESRPPPKLWEHVQRVFAEMKKGAHAQNIIDGGKPRHALVWEGFTTGLFREMGLPTPYYTKVIRRLQRMGCIMQLSRGGGSAPSRWELVCDPELGAFDEAESIRKLQPTRLGMLEKQVVELTDRVGQLELQLEDLQEQHQVPHTAAS